MAKGIKKIKWAGEDAHSVITNMSIANKLVTIHGDKLAYFKVGEWFPGTTEADKKKNVTWMWLNKESDIIIRQKTLAHNFIYGVRVKKKFCGPYTYNLDASITGAPSGLKEIGLKFRGYCQASIVSSAWSISHGGDDVRKTYVFSYGHIINLHLDTEGINGDLVTIEIYNLQTGTDRKIDSYPKIPVVDGQINLEIKNTSTWRAKLRFTTEEEKFYIKVIANGKYVKDNKNDDEHARFLRIKNKEVAHHPKPPVSTMPLKVGETQQKADRYEPCKFDAIKITETKNDNGKQVPEITTVFDQGKRLKGITYPKEDITKTIFFEIGKDIINADGIKKLSNVLGFLLEHEHSTIHLNGYACVIGKKEDNQALSQRRSDVVKKFLVNGKLNPSRIIARGFGEVNATDDKKAGDDIKYKDEAKNIDSRRVDLTFTFFHHNAKTIVYKTTAPSIDTKKNLQVEVLGFDTKSCFLEKKKHKKTIKVTDIGLIEDASDVTKTYDVTKFTQKVYAPLSRYNPVGAVGLDPNAWKIIKYIWPANSEPNIVYVDLNSCRYFSNYDKSATLAIMSYPDIKWTFGFFVNLSNKMSVGWQKLMPQRHKELRASALKLANEAKGKYTEVEFGVELKASFDKQMDNSYFSNPELTAKYEAKISKLFSVISSLKKFSQGITSQTKGKISQGIGRKLPFAIMVNPPAFYLSAEWEADFNDSRTEVGTKITLALEAKPLIEVTLVIDLLALAVQAGVAVASGGTGNALALQLFNKVREWSEKGIETDNVEMKFKMWIDLDVKGTVNGTAKTEFSTVKSKKEVDLSLESNITLEIKAGIELKGAYIAIGTVDKPILDAHAEAKLQASAKAGLTSKFSLKYESDKGILLTPSLKVDPCIGQVVLMVKVGFTYKKISSDWTPINYNGQKTFYDGFDVVEKLSDFTGIKPELLLWDKRKQS